MSRKPTLVWHARKVEEALVQMMTGNINASLAHLEKVAKQRLSRSNGSGKNPSRPGEYPKRVLGNLRAAVGFDPAKRVGNKVRGRFGVRGDSPAGPYAKRQELGFVGVVDVPAHRRNSLGFGGTKVGAYSYFVDYSARPFIRPTVRSEMKVIAGLLRAASLRRNITGRLSGKAGS